MSVDHVATFEQLVRALMSGDNAQRGAAEDAFNKAKEQPDTLFGCLLTLLRTSTDAQVRARARLAAHRRSRFAACTDRSMCLPPRMPRRSARCVRCSSAGR